ncbi:MAG TPA: glycosyltransferase [Flavobacteriales bacterium]|nr:glycosyltransferase [Flavobacteriales bacterium]
MPNTKEPLRILVVGQTPPPFGGQAVMISNLLAGEFHRLKLHHVRMAFSSDMESVGKFAVGKVLKLFTTIGAIWWARIRYRTPVLYYPPSGPNKVPVLRDIILLCSTRWFFRKVVFHFHAGGVSTFEQELPGMLRPFFRYAYRNAALAIRTAPQNPEDGIALGAHRSVVVPNGIDDARGTVPVLTAGPGEPLTILFTGVLVESKGVRVLLEAFHQLLLRGSAVRLQIMGKWNDEGLREWSETFINENHMEDKVVFLGVLRDREKYERFAACDIFCFPSYFEAESFGLVLVEAMQFSKPLVSTNWRGIPSVVQDGVNGFLVPTKDHVALADKLAVLCNDPGMRKRMGQEGERIFGERFTLEAFYHAMEEELAMLA